jgi:hypothetical protein
MDLFRSYILNWTYVIIILSDNYCCFTFSLFRRLCEPLAEWAKPVLTENGKWYSSDKIIVLPETLLHINIL